MAALSCLRCGTKMEGPRSEKIQLGQTGLLFGDWPNLLAGALETDIYRCPQCGKMEFFAAGMTDGDDDETLPQKECPGCGLSIDFDYPKCPCCGHEFF